MSDEYQRQIELLAEHVSDFRLDAQHAAAEATVAKTLSRTNELRVKDLASRFRTAESSNSTLRDSLEARISKMESMYERQGEELAEACQKIAHLVGRHEGRREAEATGSHAIVAQELLVADRAAAAGLEEGRTKTTHMALGLLATLATALAGALAWALNKLGD